MILQESDVDVLDKMPACEPSIFVRICCFVFCPFVSRLREQHRILKESKLEAHLRHVQACADRADVKQLLGNPRFAVQGRGFEAQREDGELLEPDVVEMYFTNGYVTSLWFKEGTLCHISAWVEVTSWDYLTSPRESAV